MSRYQHTKPTSAVQHVTPANQELSKATVARSFTPGETLLPLTTVEKKTGFGKSFIYAEMAEGRFPQKVSIGPKSSRWVLSEIEIWIADRIADRDGGPHATQIARVSP